MKFWKMNGAGNDFIIINNNEEHIPHDILPRIVKLLCRDRMSLGADGFMVVEDATKGSGADFCMLFFNNDGSMGEMCGNGARCISRYGIENGLCKDGTARIETTAGIVTGKRIDQIMYRVRLNDPMVLEPDKEMIIDERFDFWKGYACERSLQTDSNGRLVINAGYVELGRPGSPHLVVEYSGNVSKIGGSESLRDADLKELYKLGEALRFNSALPKGANVNFYEILSPDHDANASTARNCADNEAIASTRNGSAGGGTFVKSPCGSVGDKTFVRSSSGSGEDEAFLRFSCGSAGGETFAKSPCGSAGDRTFIKSPCGSGENEAFLKIHENDAGDEVFVRTYERGVEDFTLACGTGAGSTAAVLTLKEKVSGDNVRIQMLGGDLYVDVEEVDEEPDGTSAIHGLYLTGPTNVVAKGEITDDNLAGVLI